jgi:hypothetical protein
MLHRVGVFLRCDGNFRQAIELLEKSVRILDMVQGSSGIDTLTAMSELGRAYGVQGRLTDAVTLRENLVQTCQELY